MRVAHHSKLRGVNECESEVEKWWRIEQQRNQMSGDGCGPRQLDHGTDSGDLAQRGGQRPDNEVGCHQHVPPPKPNEPIRPEICP